MGYRKAMEIDLDKLDLKQLRELRARVDRAIGDFEERRKRDARAAVERAAREHGFNLSELTAERQARGGRKPAGTPRYANPNDPSQTWTGRGRRPGWVQQMLAEGKSLDDAAI